MYLVNLKGGNFCYTFLYLGQISVTLSYATFKISFLQRMIVYCRTPQCLKMASCKTMSLSDVCFLKLRTILDVNTKVRLCLYWRYRKAFLWILFMPSWNRWICHAVSSNIIINKSATVTEWQRIISKPCSHKY